MRDFTFGFKLCLNKEQPIKYRQQEFYKKINNELVKIPNKKNIRPDFQTYLGMRNFCYVK